jgi:hypothetical protein
MNRSDRVQFRRRTFALTGLSVVCLVISCAPPTQTSWREEDLPQPKSITIDDLVCAPQAQGAIRAARFYCAFWDTDKSEYVEAAVGPGFSDSTLPEGWRQGPEGLKAASSAFRMAAPV